jgi:hypothetical protein
MSIATPVRMRRDGCACVCRARLATIDDAAAPHGEGDRGEPHEAFGVDRIDRPTVAAWARFPVVTHETL